MSNDAKQLREIQSEIERLDKGQLHIIRRLDDQDKLQAEQARLQSEQAKLQEKQARTLDSIVTSQTEQTAMLKPISDYFAFGRVGKSIIIAMASIGAFAASMYGIFRE